jgi:predicted transposase/invertase (TIGR01784 family)
MLNELKTKLFEKAFQAAEIAKFNPGQRDAYENSLKYYRDLKNVVDTSFEEGKIEGKLEGLEEGIQKGKVEMVLQMLQAGLPVEQIAQISGLSAEEINKLSSNA